MSYWRAGVYWGLGLMIGIVISEFDLVPERLLGGVSELLGKGGKEEVLAEVEKGEGGVRDKDIEEKKLAATKPLEKTGQTLEGIYSKPAVTELNFNIDLSGATIRVVDSRMEVREQAGVGGAVGTARECVANEYSVPSRSGVYIAEVAWMGTSWSPMDEWIELKNTRGEPIDLSGWSLVNGDGGLRVDFPAGSVMSERGLWLLERTDDSTVQGVAADLVYKGALANEEEALFLFDAYCQLVDKAAAAPQWPAGTVDGYRTMERDWVTLAWRGSEREGGTPGQDGGVKVIPASGPTVVVSGDGGEEQKKIIPIIGGGVIRLSEIKAGSEQAAADEFVEISNEGAAAVDLTGWVVKKKTGSGSETTLVASSRLEGKEVAPGGKFLMANEGGYSGTVAADVGWAQSNTLAYTNNAVVIYDATGVVVDEASWEEIPKDKSYERTREGWQVREVPGPENSQGQ